MVTKRFLKRINYTGKISNLCQIICQNYNLKEYKTHKVIEKGYQDLNIIIQTKNKKKYFCKIFASKLFPKERSLSNCKRYISIIKKAIESNINHPKLLKDNKNQYLNIINNGKVKLCVMEYINGKDYLSSNYNPKPKDIKEIAKQAALINQMKIKTSPITDSWLVLNLIKKFNKVKKKILKKDLILIKPIISDFKKINLINFPKCFVHGDIRKGNVIKDKKGKNWIIDFGTDASINRKRGFIENINKEFKIIDSTSAYWDKENAYFITKKILSNNILSDKKNKIDNIFACNDEMALGAIKACEELNKKIKVVGFDGVEDALDAINNNKMSATVSQSTDQIGKNILLRAIDILEGKKVPDVIFTELKIIEKKYKK